MADDGSARGKPTARPLPLVAYRGDGAAPGVRLTPEETAVAIVHDASATAVMMATPADLEDFAIGFSLTEGVISSPDEVRDLEIVDGELGIELRLWLTAERSTVQAARRRRLAGPSGCGVCGVESLEAALRPCPPVGEGFAIAEAEVQAALEALTGAQTLGAATRGVHAAGWWRRGDGLVAIREDVGRHNALDKLGGALARRGEAAGEGAVILTSRVSVEMVQKAAVMGAQVLVAVSAPTALAVRTAEGCGMTLAAVARADGFEVFTRADRIAGAR